MKKLFDGKGWGRAKIESLVNIINPKVKELKTIEYMEKGDFPIIDQSKEFIAGYANYKSRLFTEPLPVIVFGDHTKILKYIDFPFLIGSSGVKIIAPKDPEKVDTKFLYYAFKLVRIPEKSGGYARHAVELLEQHMHYPLLEEQKKIVEILTTLDKKLSIQNSQKQKLERVKQGLMNDLLTGKKRVKS